MNNNNFYDDFFKIYKRILYKQFNTISNSKNFLFISDITPSDKEVKINEIPNLLENLDNKVNLMDQLFFKDTIIYSNLKLILSYFKSSEKNLSDDLISLEKNYKYFYSFKEDNIIEKYVNDYMNIIVDITVLVSKIFYIIYLEKLVNFKIIEDHLNFIEILKDFTFYLFTGQSNSNNIKFKNILENKNKNDINLYLEEYYNMIYMESLKILEDYPNLCKDCVFYPKLNFYNLLNFFDSNSTLQNELPAYYESVTKKIDFLFEEMVLYIQSVLNILKSDELSTKYLSFPNVLLLTDTEYKNLRKSSIIKSNSSNYIENKDYTSKDKIEKLVFNLSYIDLPNNKTLISYRTVNISLIENIEPKNINYCYNIFNNEKRSNENTFMWDKWSTINTVFEISTQFELLDTNNIYDGVFSSSKNKDPIFNKIIGYDHRFQKIDIDKNEIQIYQNNFDNMDPFEKDDKYFYVLLYDTMITQFTIYGIKNDKISTKQFLVPNGSDLFKYVELGKNKNYSFVENFIDKNLNIIFIFSEWFYKDGLKFLYVNINDFNVFTLNTVYENINITGIPINNDYPYFSFTTNTIKYNSIFIGVGHTKIKNGYDNKQCNNPKSITDFINYYTYGKNYIRHFGATNVNQIYYYNGNYKSNLNKNSEEVRNDGVDEDWDIMDQDTKCIGYQYYMFFYIFEFLENTDKLKYFKISNSFIPRINNLHKTYKDYHYSLIFPMSIVLQNDNTVSISGGEGDVRSFLINYNIDDILNICEFDISKIDINQYKFYPCT